MHLTFLRWQASQARLMIGGVVDEDDSGMVVGERRMPLGDGTSRGPDDRLDSNILAMRLHAGKDRRSPCGTECRYVKLTQAQRQRQFREGEEGLESAGKKAGSRVKRVCHSWCREVARQKESGMWLAASDSDSNRERGAEGKRALDWVAVMASQRIGPPYGLDFRSRMSPGTQRNSARISLGLAGRPRERRRRSKQRGRATDNRR